MTDAEATQRRALRDWLRWLGGASEGGSVLELDGVMAAIVPAVPQRSIINSVVYETPAQLAAAYDTLAAAYDAAGIAAWTVWTPEHDAEAISLLTGAGHAFDGEPLAMVLDLGGWEPPDPDGLERDTDVTIADLGRINEEAYGEHAEGMAQAFARDPGGIRYYGARSAGELACVLATIDHDDDLGVYFVATPERHRGQGHARRLLAAALTEGRERGLRTSSLQSSKLGQPVYERLGYRAHHRLHLYERRYVPADG